MNGVTGHIANFLWTQSWQIALLCALAWLACRFLRQASAHWRYLLLLVVLAKCLVPAAFEFSMPGVSEILQKPFHSSSFQSSPVPDAQPVRLATPRQAPVANEAATFVSRPAASVWNRTTIRNALMAAWGLGALLYLIHAAGSAFRIQRNLQQTRTWPDMELECEFIEMVQALGIRSRPKLCLIRGISQPFVWGLVRGCIYLPEGFSRQGTPQQRKLVLAHELAHVLRWDALVNFVQIVAQAIFFFHPLVWWLNKRIRHEREKCCDEMAIASLGVNSRDYGNAIIDRLVRHFEPAIPASALAISGHAKDLEDRIKTILVPNRSFYRRPSVAAILVIVATACTAVPVGVAVLPEPAPPVRALANFPEPVDLSRHLNAATDQSWLAGAKGSSLIGLPKGPQVLGGVAFDINGIVQLSASGGVDKFPGAMPGIAVRRGFQRVHLLHGASGQAGEGVNVAKLILHYEDGKNAELNLNYGEHLRDWNFSEFEATTSKSTVMAWTGASAEGHSLRLYRTTLVNPRPTVSVTHVDYIAGQSASAPFIVALTVD
jgi:beta-lactamase regulating signal transducer with metallopeptidase domain